MLAIELLHSVPSSLQVQHEEELVLGDGEWRELPAEPNLRPIREKVSRMVKELDYALKEHNWRPDDTLPAYTDAGSWTLGSVEQRAPARKVHLGFLEPIRRFPLVESVPRLVVAFLARIPGWDDYLKRENHPGVGWHYHYLVDPRKRSDALLAWDTRWQRPLGSPMALHPFFGEKHGEGKAHVHAKPWLWGDKKKKSMYEVCARDLLKWKIDEFRCASSHADPVWPSSGKVTPLPAPAHPSAGATGQKKKRR